MPACGIPANIPLENVDAIEKALADHGFY